MGKANKYAIRRVVVSFFLLLYLLVAALNSTIVQSYLGAVVSDYFSKEWGGKVRIGALHASPFSHVILDKIELISPTNDTIYYGDRITCPFISVPSTSVTAATTSTPSATPTANPASTSTSSSTTMPLAPPLIQHPPLKSSLSMSMNSASIT